MIDFSLWHAEYLFSLREETRDLYQSDFNNIFKVDDAMLIKNPAQTRPYWPLGKVVAVISGDDNCVTTKIKRPDGNILLHSLKHLCLLELYITRSHKTTVSTEELSDFGDPSDISAFSVIGASVSTSKSRPCRNISELCERNDDYIWYLN